MRHHDGDRAEQIGHRLEAHEQPPVARHVATYEQT